MKSTGEVLGVAGTLEEALYKGLIGAGYKMKKKGGVFITVRNSDKAEIGEIAKKYYDLGFRIYATEGTADVLKKYGIDAVSVKKIHESKTNNTLTLIESGKIQYVISTSAKGRIPSRDSVKIRRKMLKEIFRVLHLLTRQMHLQIASRATIHSTARSLSTLTT
mgnify:CR=1 FL=1